MSEVVKFRSGNLLYPVTLETKGNRIFVHMAYNKNLIAEVKAMEGAKWHGFEETNPQKVWSIAKSPRNQFQIDYLTGKNPYAVYDKPLIQIPRVARFNHELNREIMPYEHQFEMTSHMITRKCCIVAGEMGTGKSLSMILAMEWLAAELGIRIWWTIANKAGVRAFERELWIWGSKITPTLMVTYDGLVKIMSQWKDGDPAPQGADIDESSRAKNATTKRSQGCLHLSRAIRDEHKEHAILEMSGSPAPKVPTDWWNQCEIACPGFLREGSTEKLKKRMALVVEKENVITGGTYPELLTWFDNELKCKVCGKFESEHNLQGMDPIKAELAGIITHEFQKSENEVYKLYERMKGLVIVKFKKDCLDLPEKQYKILRLTPSAESLRTARAIVDSAPSAIQGLTLLRELSDGFQYQDRQVGTMQCPVCKGAKERLQQVEVKQSCPNCTGHDVGSCLNHQPAYQEAVAACDGCNGSGEKPRYQRFSVEVPCPKEDALREILEDHEELGRLVCFAGFTGAIDRCVKIASDLKWNVIQVDSRGWICKTPKGEILKIDPLEMFQGYEYDKVLWIGHPQSGGTSVTLTRSPTIVYYSNSFNGEDRIQSEDRIHRLGMDANLGATIIDLFHLPSDEKVYMNVKAKRDLQNMTLGELKETMQNVTERTI